MGLIVVGVDGVTSLLLGSVSHACVQQAACPVVIVRDRAQMQGEREAA